ncbi:MAG: hypothetical protein RBS80_00285 [Thermoguttaceae bacterium]|jgi:hypothetical protein|nr:hypothetical protein [Thermoguttaceae bacterium]
MMRTWIAVALLAGSWLIGLRYYYTCHPVSWLAVVAAGTLMMIGTVPRLPGRRELWIALALFAVPALLAPWPVRTAAILLLAGLLVELLPPPHAWPRLLGRAAATAGLVLLAQWPAMALFTHHTARSHELPGPFPELLAGVMRLFGADVTADGSTLVIVGARQVHRLGATYALLLDPAMLCFLAGGLALLGLAAWSTLPRGKQWAGWLRAARALVLVVLVWMAVRTPLMIGIYLHRAMRADWDQPLNVMDQFLNPWVLMLLLAGPVLLAWRFVRVSVVEAAVDGELSPSDAPPAAEPEPTASLAEPSAWAYAGALVLVALSAALATVAFRWAPSGSAKGGRVMVVERHSEWEPTVHPYDTEWYGHDSGYNYGAIYRYCKQFFEMSQLLEEDSIDDAKLAECDVLVIKTPTAHYLPDEVAAVQRFVENGGGLLLVGEHTNFERGSTYFNDICRPMGFTFRHDLLFGMDNPYDHLYVPPWVPHPVVSHMPPMEFAIACSIDPGRSSGWPVIEAASLWSMPPDYRPDNFFPMPQHTPTIRYGAFIELWGTTFGKGRVLAFGDSTIFSNFCTFQPGKAELMRDMLAWLNYTSPFDVKVYSFFLRAALSVLAAAALFAGVVLALGRPEAWLALLGAAVAGWVLAGLAVATTHRTAFPEPKALRPQTRVVIDRTVSEVLLCKGAFIEGDGDGYGLLEQWIPRLGYYIRRESGPAAFSGDALVVITPTRAVSRQYQEQLVRYVEEGGNLLVIETPENTGSTANSLLWPFGLSVHPGQAWRGTLAMAGDWPGIPVSRALEVSGGEPIARLGTRPIGAMTQHGKGRVVAVGFGSLLNDAGMGYQWTVEPDDALLNRFETLYSLVRLTVEGTPIAPPEEPDEEP